MNDEYEEEIVIKIENIFSEESVIDEIYENASSVNYVFEILETFYRRSTGNINQDSNMLVAISEFHVNNLIFLKENFKFPNLIICKLLNLLNLLLNLKEKESLRRRTEEEIPIVESIAPDFSEICKRKLLEVKKGFFELGLVSNKFIASDNAFHLKGSEVLAIMDYIKTFYFPFIRLYYHFVNIEKITENRKIEVIINRPLAVPPLSAAVMQVSDKNLFDEQKEDVVEETKQDKKESGDKKETKEEEKKEEKPETYQDLMNKLNLNAETKKIIAEKIEEMYKEVDYKIIERQKKLDDKYKELEDTVKGKKK